MARYTHGRYEPAAPSLLLEVSADGRYLQRATGEPFLVWGIAAWNINSENTEAEWTERLDYEAANGVNAILIQLISRYQTNAPNDIDGVAPFTTPGDLATVNPVYLAKAKTIIDYAATKGIVCWVAPAWYGYDPDQGWYNTLVSNGLAKCEDYGEAVATALGSCQNIVWIAGGDKPSPVDVTYTQAIIDGIRNVTTTHLVTAHWNFEEADQYPVVPLDIAGCYSWGAIPAQCAQEYADGDSPVIVLESVYEGNTGLGGYTSEKGRAWTMESMISGAKGFFWGHEGTWHCGSADTHLPSQSQGFNYAASLDSVDRAEFKHCRTAFEGRDWHLLVPDTTDDFLTAGSGTAAITPTGDYAVIYSPSGGQTIDRTEMSASFNVRYLDPTTGIETLKSGGPFPATGSMTLTPTTDMGNNSRGATDWIVVLETA